MQEVEKVSRIYYRQCESPPQLRGFPPVAGMCFFLFFIFQFIFCQSEDKLWLHQIAKKRFDLLCNIKI